MKTATFFFQQCVWIIGLIGCLNTASAQDYDGDFQKAKSLYQTENYRSARLFFQKSAENAPHQTAYRSALAFQIICGKKLNYKSFQVSAEQFLERFPICTQANELRFHLGDFYFQQGKYELAKIYFQEISLTNPKTATEIEATYKLAYTLFLLRKYDESEKYFNLIKQKNHIYQDACFYYSGYIRYLNKEYEGAIRNLNRVSQTSDNQTKVAQLIAHILFLNQDYEQSITYAEKLIETYPEDEKLNSILGNSYYTLHKYSEALPFLQKLLLTSHRNATLQFQVGMCLLKQRKSLEATEYLRVASELNPENAQIWYHLGVACAQVENPKYLTLAQESFKNCRKPSEFGYLHEVGALNYATISHKLKDYEAVLEGCEFYRYHYPKGEYLQDINSLTLKACMNGDDYFGAVDYLQRIEEKTPEIKKAFQRVLFNKAVELFEVRNFAEAHQTFRQSLKFPYDERLINQANYWLGEIGFRDSEFNEALKYYFRVPAYAPEYVTSLYGIGYAYFKLNQYQKAKLFFEDFLKFEQAKNKPQRLEVMTRIADCLFATKNYKKALQKYDMLLLSEIVEHSEKGYLFLQKGLILNQLSRFLEAIPMFDQVITHFQNETYTDFAYWHQAEAYEQISDYEKAIEPLNYLIFRAENTDLKPSALLKRGKIYLKTNNFEDGIADFQQVIYQYPAEKTAIRALNEMQKLHEKGIEIANFESFVKKIGKKNTEFLKMQVAEIRQTFRQKKYHLSIGKGEKFMARFPNSTFQNEVQYWVGSAFWGMKDKENALKNLYRVRADFEAKAQHKILDIQSLKVKSKVEEKPNSEPMENIDQMVKNKDFDNAKNALHAHYHKNNAEGEYAVYLTMKILIEEQSWSSVEATFYDFKKRFPNSKRYYGSVLMVSKALIRMEKKIEAKGFLNELLEHCRNRTWQIKAKALLHKL